mgnify:CR=1 FL=1
MPIRYLKLNLCEGCPQCLQQLPTGHVVQHQHVLEQIDVTEQIKPLLRKVTLFDHDIVDVDVRMSTV